MNQGYAKAAVWNAGHIIVASSISMLTGLILVLIPMLMIGPAWSQSASFEDGYAAYQRGEFFEARSIWEDLAQAGDARAMFNLGTMYSEGRGIEPDAFAAQEYWRLAAETGHVRAMHNLALSHIASAGTANEDTATEDYRAAVIWLERASESGFANSQYTLGKMYQYGLSVPHDEQQAVSYYTLAADQGFARAQYNLGKAFRDGRGVERDLDRSLAYFHLAAEQGHAAAQNRLATRYARGDGVEQSDVTALVWASLAADQGDVRGAENRNLLLTRMSNAQVDEAALRILNFTQRP